jgi:hypothetical protein
LDGAPPGHHRADVVLIMPVRGVVPDHPLSAERAVVAARARLNGPTVVSIQSRLTAP